MIEHEISTPDGRVLAVREHGPPDGAPVLVHNGTPNSRLMFSRDVARAERQGIRLITYDRPGYGGSTRQPGRSIADCAQDVRTIATALDIAALGVWGISGGGPHALACAALLEDLVPAVAVLAAVAPWEAPGLDYFDGMGELNVEDTQLILEDPIAARAKCETNRLEMLMLGAEDLAEHLRTLLAPVDAAALTPDRAAFMVESTRLGLAAGSDGWWDDDYAFLQPWGFQIDAIRTPVRLYHGRQDRFVPFAHGEWLASHIPGVKAELSDEDGHLTLTERHLYQVHKWLAGHF